MKKKSTSTSTSASGRADKDSGGDDSRTAKKNSASVKTEGRKKADSVNLAEENKLFVQLRRAARALTNIYNSRMPQVCIETATGISKNIQVKVTQLAVMKALYDTSWWDGIREKRVEHAGGSTRDELAQYYYKMAGRVVQVDLAKHLNLDCTTVCRNLKALIESGWVVSSRSEVNQREVLIGLTASGRQVVEEACHEEEITSRELRDKLGADFWNSIEGDLEKLVAKLEKDLANEGE
ncbi:MAG: MarR family winged helix-turn-helix transcriptional regulator [bacterium]|nr:MarR family winged helix-turn-helix transcriptional regulator [bacterium]